MSWELSFWTVVLVHPVRLLELLWIRLKGEERCEEQEEENVCSLKYDRPATIIIEVYENDRTELLSGTGKA